MKKLVLMFVIVLSSLFSYSQDTLVYFNHGKINTSTCNWNNIYLGAGTYNMTYDTIIPQNSGPYYEVIFTISNIITNDYNASSVKIYINDDTIQSTDVLIGWWTNSIDVGAIIPTGIDSITKLVITFDKNSSSITKYNVSKNTNSKLINVIDLTGRKVNPSELKTNTIYIYQYENGTTEKKMIF
jgi:hypothetical protein